MDSIITLPPVLALGQYFIKYDITISKGETKFLYILVERSTLFYYFWRFDCLKTKRNKVNIGIFNLVLFYYLRNKSTISMYVTINLL